MPPPGASAAEFIHLYFRNSFSGQHMVADPSIRLRPLEREDLPFIHQLDNNASVMRYWFEEPYEAFVELTDLYDKHIHDQSERRFIVEHDRAKVGLVELVEIDYVHRRAEFQIIIAPAHQGLGYAAKAGGVIGYFARFDVFFHARLAQELVGDATFLLADAFHQTGRQGPAGVHVDQFVLDGRTAGV